MKEHKVPKVDLSKAREGDIIVRALGGVIPMELRVESNENGIITAVGGWTFDVETQMEIDEDLNWGPKYGATGSFITHLIQ